MKPYLLPKALPDETLYSLVSRIAWLNGIPGGRQTRALLYGDVGETGVSDAAVDLAHFCAVTENAFGHPDDVLNNLTIWPLLRNMATHSSVESVRAESPHDRRQFTYANLGLAALSNAQPHIWRWCSACATSDLEAHGTAYWHRAHQLPGVVLCEAHRSPLNEANICYWTRQQSFLNLETVMTSHDSAVSCEGTCTDSALEMARFARSALEGADGETTPSVVRGAFLDGLHGRNLISGKAHVNPHEFAGSFLEHFRDLTHIAAFQPHLNTAALTRVAKLMTSSPVVLPPALGLMIASWLFGSWQLFRSHCEWRRIVDAPEPHLPTEVLANTSERHRKAHRQACLEFMASVPGASRSDFWHAHPKASRWLAKFDSAWLDSRLPKAKRHAPVQPQLF